MRHFSILLLLCTFMLSSAARSETISAYEHTIMRSVPSLALKAQKSDIHSLKDYEGKVILLNFWATWCKPCLEEMPAFSRLQERLDASKIQVVPVSVDRKGLAVSGQFMTRLGVDNLPILLDTEYAALSRFKLRSLPTTVVINRNHREVARVEGVIDWEDESVVQYLEALAEQPLPTK